MWKVVFFFVVFLFFNLFEPNTWAMFLQLIHKVNYIVIP